MMQRMHRLGSMLVASVLAASTLAAAATAAEPAKNRLSGVVVAVSGNTMILRTRTGTNVTVDLSEARAAQHVGIIAPHVAVEVKGTYLPGGTFHCVSTSHAGPGSQSWEVDR